jgi:biopolymer transport protein ExbD
LRFELDDRGGLVYQGSAMDWASAEQEIRRMIGAHPNLAVVLSIAPQAPWQTVVSFVELAQKLEVDSFSFSMKAISAPGGSP